MKLDEFISKVLLGINNGISDARQKANRRYQIETASNSGINFDIAVTTTKSTGTEATGNAKAGFVEVLGAGVGAKLTDKHENSEVNRIQFSIYVPSQTEQEEAESRRILQSHTRTVDY